MSKVRRWVIFIGLALMAIMIIDKLIAENTASDGTIVEKTHLSTTTQFMIVGGRPYPLIFSECWRITFKKDGKTGAVCASEAEWNRYDVGQRYP